jgi:hypothetical protein
MSATTPAHATTTADIRSSRPLGPDASAPHPVARFGGPIALVVGSVLAAVGMGLHLPAMAEDVGLAVAVAEAPSRWLAAHLFAGLGFALVALAATTALPPVHRRGATLTAVGVGVTSLGAAVMALGDIAHGAVAFALTERVDAATSFAIQEAYFEHPAILGLNTGPMLISLGMVLLGAGLLRARIHARWVGITILVAPIAINVAISLGLPTYLHGVPFVVGMSVLAYSLLRDPRAGSAPQQP